MGPSSSTFTHGGAIFLGEVDNLFFEIFLGGQILFLFFSLLFLVVGTFFLGVGSTKKFGVGGEFFLRGGFFGGRILGNFRPFSVTNERSEKSAHFPGKWADFSLSARAEGGGRRADFTEGPSFDC